MTKLISVTTVSLYVLSRKKMSLCMKEVKLVLHERTDVHNNYFKKSLSPKTKIIKTFINSRCH